MWSILAVCASVAVGANIAACMHKPLCIMWRLHTQPNNTKVHLTLCPLAAPLPPPRRACKPNTHLPPQRRVRCTMLTLVVWRMCWQTYGSSLSTL